MNSNKPKRLLCIVGGMNAGGAETFLMKIYRTIDRTKYQMDFFVFTKEEGFYEKEILSMGGRIYHSTPKSKHPIKSFISLLKTVRREKYEYVLRSSQHSLSSLDLLAAKLGGARTLVYRSNNSNTGGGRINRLLHTLFKWLSMTIPTIKIAPSTEAAEFMFGKNCIKKGEAIIVKNAIPVEDFLFNQEKRNKIRSEFGLNDNFVIGHVGRFNKQKNHGFLIDIFNEIVKKHKKSTLLLVGKGELESYIKKKIKKLGLDNKVIFTGIRSDVPDIMMAMDIYIFPSLFEGMPNTVIEAQATGLPCIISNTITKEVNITGNVKYLPIDASPELWAKEALQFTKGYNRKNMKLIFIKSGYDINFEANKLMKMIFENN